MTRSPNGGDARFFIFPDGLIYGGPGLAQQDARIISCGAGD